MDQEIQNINTTTLAYMGDAVYEVRVREMLIEHDPHDVGKLHKMAVRYVSAEGQAKAMRRMKSASTRELEIIGRCPGPRIRTLAPTRWPPVSKP